MSRCRILLVAILAGTLVGCAPQREAIRGVEPLGVSSERGGQADQGTVDRSAGNKWAILIGVDKYAHAKQLRYCGADMKALADELEVVGFPRKHVFLLHDKTEDRPTRSNILERLADVLKHAAANDLVLVAFSGHGIHRDGSSYLCPADARLEDPETLVPLDQVYKRLQGSPAAFKIILVDACRNDPQPDNVRGFASATDNRQAVESLEKFAVSLEHPPKGVIQLTSCSPGETSREDCDFGHGVFMHFLIEGLRGRAANKDGCVSILDLYQYASGCTANYVKERFDGASQEPMLKGELRRNCEIARLPNITPSPTSDAKEFTNALGMSMLRIDPGDFVMGSPNWDQEAEHQERPAHLVRISRPFYLGRCEVTRAQFRKFISANKYKTEAERQNTNPLTWISGGSGTWLDPGYPQNDDHPAVCVSWDDANAFCAWLSRADRGRTYRLPTEAEWEYACRAGSGDTFCYGADPNILTEYGWFFPNSSNSTTQAVARKRPNSWGLFDMHGNVSEWCADLYDASYYGRSPTQDPLGPDADRQHQQRVARGGWFHAKTAASCRSAKRFAYPPQAFYDGLGFRVAANP